MSCFGPDKCFLFTILSLLYNSVEDILSSQIIAFVMFKLWSLLRRNRRVPCIAYYSNYYVVSDWLDVAAIITSIVYIIPVVTSFMQNLLVRFIFIVWNKWTHYSNVGIFTSAYERSLILLLILMSKQLNYSSNTSSNTSSDWSDGLIWIQKIAERV